MNEPVIVHPTLYHLVMLSFDGTRTAADVLHKLKTARALEGCEIEAEALVSRDASGAAHYHEAGSAGIGAAFGATTAGMLGLVGGPVVLLLMLVAGGLIGGVAGHFMGQVLPREDLETAGESLPPSSSAYLAVVDTAHADCVADNFAAEGARVLNAPVEMDISCAIREAITHSLHRV